MNVMNASAQELAFAPISAVAESIRRKELSPVDELEFFNPFDETHPIKFKPKEKNVAPGYYRVPSA